MPNGDFIHSFTGMENAKMPNGIVDWGLDECQYSSENNGKIKMNGGKKGEIGSWEGKEGIYY